MQPCFRIHVRNIVTLIELVNMAETPVLFHICIQPVLAICEALGKIMEKWG